MTPELIFDCHLDLAWNALDYNRDLRLPLERIRAREMDMTEKSRGRNTVCFPEMRRGRIGLCVATQLARHVPFFGRSPGQVRLPGYASPGQAWAATQGQLAWYREMERCGELVQIRNRAQLDAHLAGWLKPADAPPTPQPIGYILSLENADSIVTLQHLEKAWADGLRAIGPVHYGPGVYGHGTDDEGPLTPRGRELLQEMERLGVILDVTHFCDESFWDALDHYHGPMWASHSNCRVLANWNRQFNDDQLKELIRRGAVIGVAFDAIMMVHGWARGRSQPQDFGLKIEKIGEHIDHICQLAGNADHVGLGTDLDGGFGTEQTPLDLNSIADLARMGDILAGRGYSSEDVRRICHGNFIAFLRESLAMTDVAPTQVRRQIVAVTMAAAFILYLDRICLAEIVKSASFHADVALSKTEIGRVLASFFLAYALFQVPAGWISDRFGARAMLTLYIFLWSLFTALTGVVSSFPGLLAMRLLCGAAEAGAYPTSNVVIRQWIPLAARARASSCVTVGGRIGGTVAPFLTAWMVVELGHWRPVLWIDGAVGILIAALYWIVVRNSPAEHPRTNAAERALIDASPPRASFTAREMGAILGAFCRSGNLWTLAGVMFLINIGFAFLITWLPTYLKEQHHVEDVAGGRMVTLILAGGMLGQLFGGWFTDWCTQRLGLKRGRILPLFVAGFVAGTSYMGCLFIDSTWALVACCGLVSFSSDMGNPANWAIMQDIGGPITGVTVGWANMWGNFGAVLTAQMVPWLATFADSGVGGHRLVFGVCGCALFCAGLLALRVDASRQLTYVRPQHATAARA